MASNANIQFFGIDNAISAFENRDLPGWALFQGKAMIGAGVGKEELQAFLKFIENSSGVYTLKVYDTDNESDIDDQTPARGSFNFKPLESPGYPGGRAVALAGAGPSPGGIAGVIQSRIEAKLATRIDAMLDRLDDDDEKEPETIGAIISGYLSDPEKLVPIIGVIKNLFTQGAAGAGTAYQPMPAIQPAAVHYPAQAAVGSPVLSQEDKYSRIGQAVETLERSDPDIVQHLEMLADLSVKNPSKFQTLISMLGML